MRSKAPLALMEQMVMILIFALAAALCLQAFVQSDVISQESEARDQAVILAQSVAECIKDYGGDLEAAVNAAAGRGDADGRAAQEWNVEYSESWAAVPDGEGTYLLTVRPLESGVPGMGKAGVYVSTAGEDGELLFELEIAWQEVSGDE